MTVDATVQNIVATATWQPGFVSIWLLSWMWCTLVG